MQTRTAATAVGAALVGLAVGGTAAAAVDREPAVGAPLAARVFDVDAADPVDLDDPIAIDNPADGSVPPPPADGSVPPPPADGSGSPHRSVGRS